VELPSHRWYARFQLKFSWHAVLEQQHVPRLIWLNTFAGLKLSFDFSDWERWAVPAVVFLVGAVSAGITLLLGRLVFRSRGLRLPPPVAGAGHYQRDPFFYGSASEKRGSVRRTGKLIKVLISDAKALNKPMEGWVIDRSMGGLCVAVADKVPETTILSLRTVDAPREVPWVQVEVRRCELRGDRFEIGCQFVRTPSWSILLLFG
jgi:hypothetical protein